MFLSTPAAIVCDREHEEIPMELPEYQNIAVNGGGGERLDSFSPSIIVLSCLRCRPLNDLLPYIPSYLCRLQFGEEETTPFSKSHCAHRHSTKSHMCYNAKQQEFCQENSSEERISGDKSNTLTFRFRVAIEVQCYPVIQSHH